MSGTDTSTPRSPMAPFTPVTPEDETIDEKEVSATLIAEHSQNKKLWRTKICRIILANPGKFRILQVGKEDDGNLKLSENEFKSHFINTPFNDELVHLMWLDMEKDSETDEVTFTSVHRWINMIKKRKIRSKKTVYDSEWLYNKLKNLTFGEMDKDEGGTIDKEEFSDFFKNEIENEDISLNTINTVYNMIDINNDGDITVKEFLTWQLNVTKNEFIEHLKNPHLARKRSFKRKKSSKTKLNMGNSLLSPKTPKKMNGFAKFSPQSTQSPGSASSDNEENSDVDMDIDSNGLPTPKIDINTINENETSGGSIMTEEERRKAQEKFVTEKTPTINVANIREQRMSRDLTHSHITIGELRNEIENLTNKFNSDTIDLHGKLADLELKNKQLTDEISYYKEEIINANEFDNSKNNRETNEYQLKLQNMGKMEKWKDKQMTELTNDLKTCQALINSQNETIDELQDRMDETESNLEIEQEKVVKIELKMDQLNDMISKLENEKMEMQNEMNHLRELLVNEQRKTLECDNLIEGLKIVNGKLRDESFEMKQKYDKQMINLQEAILTLQNENADLLDQLNYMKQNKYANIKHTSEAMQQLRDTLTLVNKYQS